MISKCIFDLETRELEIVKTLMLTKEEFLYNLMLEDSPVNLLLLLPIAIQIAIISQYSICNLTFCDTAKKLKTISLTSNDWLLALKVFRQNEFSMIHRQTKAYTSFQTAYFSVRKKLVS